MRVHACLLESWLSTCSELRDLEVVVKTADYRSEYPIIYQASNISRISGVAHYITITMTIDTALTSHCQLVLRQLLTAELHLMYKSTAQLQAHTPV